MLLVVASLVCANWAQSGTPRSVQKRTAIQKSIPTKATAKTNRGSAQLELQRRLAAQQAARAAGDLPHIEKTSESVIALALREFAQLRTFESAWPQAIEAYKQSLELEDNPAARIDLAIAYMKAKQTNDAIFECDRVLYSYPQNARAWHVKGEAYLLQKNWAKGSEALQKSTEIYPDLNALYSLGAAELMQKNKDKAVAAFQKITAQGDSAALHVLFGDAYGEGDFKNEAVTEYKRAAEMNPSLPHVHFFLGLGYLMRDEWASSQEALEALEEEVKRDPVGYFGNYYLGVIKSTYNQYEESNKYLLAATKAKPQWPEPWLFLGLNAAGQQNAEKAQGYLHKAIDLTGKDEGRNNYQIVRAYISLGRLAMARGDKETGTQLMAKARELSTKKLGNSQKMISGMGGGAAVIPVEVSEEEKQEMRGGIGYADPTAELDASVRATSKLTPAQQQAIKRTEADLRSVLASSYNDWGTAKARQQDFTKAYELFQEAEKWDANVPGVLRNVGLAAFRVGDYKEAARVLQLEEGRRPEPKIQAMLATSLFSTAQFGPATSAFAKLGDNVYSDPRLAYGYAFSLAATKQHKEASAVLNKMSAHQLSPEMVLQVGQVYGDIGDNENALACFKRAVAMDPNLTDAHYNAGLVLIRMDHPQDAVHELGQALQANPSDVNTQYNLAYAMLKAGQKEKALAILRTLTEQNPNHALAQYQLGKELLEGGQVAGAVEHLEKAAALDSNKDFIHYQLQAAYRKQGRTEEAERELKVYREIKARNREQTIPMPGDAQPE